MKRRLSTHDMGARYCGPNQDSDTEYAAVEFENMVRRAKADGVITQKEAADLVIEHVRLQQNSRDALRKMLEAYGYKQVVISGDPGTPAAKLARRISYGLKHRKLPLPQTTDHKKRKITLPEPDIDYHTKGIGISLSRPKISQKATWLSIVGPAVLASLLGVLGVI